MSKIKPAARELPQQPSLENLKKQARGLLNAVRAGDRGALARALACHPSPAKRGVYEPARFTLHEAQLVIAREYGFSSWPKLRAQLAGQAANAGLAVAVGAKLPLLVLPELVLHPYSTLHTAIVAEEFGMAIDAALTSANCYAFCVLQAVLSEATGTERQVVGALALAERTHGANGVQRVRLRYRGRARLTAVHAVEGYRLAEVSPWAEPPLPSADRQMALERLYECLEPLARRVEWLPRKELIRCRSMGDLAQMIALAAAECPLAHQQSLLSARDQRDMVELLCSAPQLIERPREPHPITEADDVSAPPQGETEACLVVIYAGRHPQLLGRRFSLGEPSTSIGRGPSNSVLLPSAAVSRLHARIEFDGAEFTLLDQNSCNGSFVAGRTGPIARHPLADGDEIALGDVILRFLRAPELRAKLRAAVAYIADHDALTRTRNQRAWWAETEYGVLLARGESQPLSVLLLELDSLAELRQRHGSLAGDALLRHVADLLRKELPPHAILGYQEGDRFVVTLPRLGVTQALSVAEQLCAAISSSEFSAFGNAASTTASIGASTLYRATGVSELLSDASQALERARQAGPNSVAGPREEAAA